MITIETREVRLRLDPDRGAEIRSILSLETGHELLFQAPWSAALAAGHPACPDTWTQAWPGGWQLLFPNAGADCSVGPRAHGFHGDASLDRWALEHHDRSGAVLTWNDGRGLSVRRSVSLDRREVSVENEVGNTGPEPAPFVLVEHLILGEPLFGPSARVHAPGGSIVPLDDSGPPLVASEDAQPWPCVQRAGALEDWSMVGSAALSRFGSLVDLEVGTVEVENGESGLAVRVDWSLDTLPYLWFWAERHGSAGFPEGCRIACLGLEPASIRTGEGLARGLERGEATMLTPGASWTSRTVLTIDARPG